jgi:hypothetical protein
VSLCRFEHSKSQVFTAIYSFRVPSQQMQIKSQKAKNLAPCKSQSLHGGF